MVDRIRSGSTHRMPTRSKAEGVSGNNEDDDRRSEETQRARIQADRQGVNGADRLKQGGDLGAEPWGQNGRGAYSNGCVASMFATEWKNQRPDEFRAAAADLRESGQVEVNGRIIKLDDDRMDTLKEKGLWESDEAVVEAALLGTARKECGYNSEGGTDAEGVAFLEDTLQLGVNLATGDNAQVGDYVAVGSGDQKHFMKVTGSGASGYELTDAFGNQTTMTASQLKSQGDYDDGDNFGNLNNAAVQGNTTVARAPRR